MLIKTSLVDQIVKNLPAMQETKVQSLGQENPLDKGIATHSSILAWRILWTEEPCRPQSMVCKELDTTEWLSLGLVSIDSLYRYIVSIDRTVNRTDKVLALIRFPCH